MKVLKARRYREGKVRNLKLDVIFWGGVLFFLFPFIFFLEKCKLVNERKVSEVSAVLEEG